VKSTAASRDTREVIARALDVDAANLALGHETFQVEGASFVRNRAYPQIYDANHVTHVTASSQDEIERLLTRVDEEYEGLGHRQFDVDFRTPPSFSARLALNGYERRDALVMLLEGDPIGPEPEHEIRPIESEADWREYGTLKELDWREHEERIKKPSEPEIGEAMSAVARLKQPPVQYWLACIKGRPLAYFNSWAGVDGIGQVEDLFTHPGFRHRGLATALIHHCVADCRRKGAGPVIIAADPTDTPKHMYAALGFRPIAIYSHYLKKLSTTSSAGS
jgi:GNAT superfamily N-acetyltransferase